MRRFVYSLLLSILILLSSASMALAKGPADKITITGTGLTKPIEITDPQILAAYSPWDDLFLNPINAPLEAAPQADKLYEVKFYVKDNGGQLQLRYVLQYAPGQPGYIYFPGREDPYYQVNTGTIIRGAMDGYWFQASQAWSEMVQQQLDLNSSTLLSQGTGGSSSNSFPMEWIGLAVITGLMGVLVWFFRKGRRPFV